MALPDIPKPKPDDALAYLTQRRLDTKAYASARGQDTFNILLYSPFGTGKTHLAATGRGPFYWYSFDPGGTKIPLLLDLEKKGMAILDTCYEKETAVEPYAFEEFDKVHGAMKKAGAYNQFGTVVIDGLTMFGPAIMNFILKRAKRPNTTPQIPDYMTFGNLLQQVVKEFCDLPCDFILIAHMDSERDELTGHLESSIMCVGKSKVVLPTLFDEVIMPKTDAAKDKQPTFSVQLFSDNRYNCSTRRFCGPQFQVNEEPDLKKLYKKAGRENWQDLSPLPMEGTG